MCSSLLQILYAEWEFSGKIIVGENSHFKFELIIIFAMSPGYKKLWQYMRIYTFYLQLNK